MAASMYDLLKQLNTCYLDEGSDNGPRKALDIVGNIQQLLLQELSTANSGRVLCFVSNS